MSQETRCMHCGADEQLHHFDGNYCPENGQATGKEGTRGYLETVYTAPMNTETTPTGTTPENRLSAQERMFNAVLDNTHAIYDERLQEVGVSGVRRASDACFKIMQEEIAGSKAAGVKGAEDEVRKLRAEVEELKKRAFETHEETVRAYKIICDTNKELRDRIFRLENDPIRSRAQLDMNSKALSIKPYNKNAGNF